MNTYAWQPLNLAYVCWSDVQGGVVARRDSTPKLHTPASSVVVMGAFDGLHKGHRQLVAYALEDAHKRGVPCVAVTFDPDPAELLRKDCLGNQLLSLNDRVCGLLRMGVDHVVVLDFTPELAGLAPMAFLDEVLLPLVRPLSIHVGTNFRFGNEGAGDGTTLEEAGATREFTVHVHELIECAGDAVSATRIRKLLGEGNLAQANQLLDRCHYVRGKVVRGRGEATAFGFPTANVQCDLRTCFPAEGVYACYVTDGNSAWPAAANVGAPPTFSEPQPAFLEANLLGFEGNLYGHDVTVSFVQWLRASRPFDSVEELERVVLGNIDWVRQHLGQERIEVGP